MRVLKKINNTYTTLHSDPTLFCPYCGSPMRDDHQFCMNCGKKVEKITPQEAEKIARPQTNTPQPNTPPVKTPKKASEKPLPTAEPPPSKDPDWVPEIVLAGFSSAEMVKPGSFGYGVYITNKRVIGTKAPGQFAKAVTGAIAGAVIGKIIGFEAPWAVSNALGRNLTNDETIHLLTELEKVKDFEVQNKDITLIQLKEPFFTELGQLAIFVNNEKTTNIAIKFGKDKTFEVLKEMFSNHFPKLLKTLI
jgi:hypothetical protein